MKKILLGSTVLGAALFAGAAQAETPKVTLGGYSDFQLGYASQDFDGDQRNGAFRTDNVITFRIDAKTDAGLGYGAAVDLHADVSDDADGATNDGTARRTYVYVDGAWGRVQAGADLGVTNTLKIGAESIAHGTGGVDGDFTYFTNYIAGEDFVSTPDLVLDHGTFVGASSDRTSENLNKISYYTPRFAGFQAGVSYLFDTDSSANRGQVLTSALSNDDDGQAENVLLGGINYEGKFDAITFGLAATGEYGDAEETSTTEDLRSWNVGGKVGYMGFSVAASYGDLGDSLTTGATLGNERSYWNVGGAYETGPFGFSVTYFESESELAAGGTNDFSNLSFSTDYKLAPGLTPYAEVDFVDIDPAAGAENDATIFLAGTQIQF